MQYRPFGKLDWKVSALGFGAMRLPVIDGDRARIDEPEATRMIRYAIDHGVNYLDTAYPYHDGKSEPFVGHALQDGYREKVRLATKMPTWLTEKPEDFDKYLNEQLTRLQTAYIDFYLLHGLNRSRWEKLDALGVLAWAEGARADGRIRYLGFSFHDDNAAFKAIVDAYDAWTFCQIQYNYMDIENQAGTAGLRYAADRGLAVVIMEPLLGGRLAKEPPQPVAALWARAAKRRSPVDWALQWLWNQPEVSVVLSGMSAMQHVVDNVAYADASRPSALDAGELALVDQVRATYKALSPVKCTKCEYCMPCPNGVNIPRIFEIYNEALMYQDREGAQRAYQWLAEEHRADICMECGECEGLCPQEIPIVEWLKDAHEFLTASAT